MPSSYSPNLRVELIANGEQSGTWGSTTNNNLGTILEDAISGYVSVVVTATSQALTALNGVADQSRNMTVNLASTSTVATNFTIYIPPAEKVYIFRNNTNFIATISAATAVNGTTPTGGATVVIPSGKTMYVFCDASNVRDAFNHVASNLSVAGTASVTGALSAASATLTTPLAANYGGTGFSSYTVGSLLFASTTSTLSAILPSTSGYVLKTQGAGNFPVWGKVDLGSAVEGALPLGNISATGTPTASTFLCGNGTWAVPAGAGDVSGPSSSTDNTVPLFNGATGKLIKTSTMAFNTTTNTLSATNFSGTFAGNGASVTALNAANVATGTLALARGGTGASVATANDLLNTLVPTQTGNGGKYLGTDGTNTSWGSVVPEPATTGAITKTAAGTYATRTLTSANGGITVTNGNGVSGNPTVALNYATDLVVGGVRVAVSGTTLNIYTTA